MQFPKTIPTKSANHEIKTIAYSATHPGFLKFSVKSSHGVYSVEGVAPLKKVISEIQVIENIRINDEGNGFFEGVGDSVKNTGDGFVKLVKDPIESGKGVGKAVGKLGGKIGGVFKKSEEGQKTTFSEKLLGSSERDLAKKFNVDVYTRNPHLKMILRNMAKARMGGQGAVTIAKFFIPVAGLVSVALTASGINGSADQFINDNDKSDVYKANQKALESLGYAPKSVKDLLNHPLYTPRESTYLRYYLEKLKTVQGHKAIFEKAIAAKTQLEAFKNLYEAQLAADGMEASRGYVQMEAVRDGLLIERADGVLLVSAYDYIDTNGIGNQMLNVIENAKLKWNKRYATLWLGGKVDENVRAAALLKGIKIDEWQLAK